MQTLRSKYLLFSLVLGASVVLSACSLPGVTSNSAAAASPQLSTTEKQGTTTKSGKITQAGGKYYIEQMGQAPLELDSYTVDLSTYVGKTVTVTGQYSGDTLFVGSLK